MAHVMAAGPKGNPRRRTRTILRVEVPVVAGARRPEFPRWLSWLDLCEPTIQVVQGALQAGGSEYGAVRGGWVESCVPPRQVTEVPIATMVARRRKSRASLRLLCSAPHASIATMETRYVVCVGSPMMPVPMCARVSIASGYTDMGRGFPSWHSKCRRCCEESASGRSRSTCNGLSTALLARGAGCRQRRVGPAEHEIGADR